MLKSTILFVAIMADLSAKYELNPKQLKELAADVAAEPEFVSNPEIKDLLEIIDTDKPLVHLKRIAYSTKLKDKIYQEDL